MKFLFGGDKMEWLFQRFLNKISDINKNINPYDSTLEKQCEQ